MRVMAITTEVPAAAAQTLVRHSWIGNREVEGRGGTRAATAPATGRAFAQVSLLDAAQAGSAIDAASAAFPAWSGLGFAERGRHLLRLRPGREQGREGRHVRGGQVEDGDRHTR